MRSFFLYCDRNLKYGNERWCGGRREGEEEGGGLFFFSEEKLREKIKIQKKIMVDAKK